LIKESKAAAAAKDSQPSTSKGSSKLQLAQDESDIEEDEDDGEDVLSEDEPLTVYDTV
jgi:hypothetical protein